MKTVALTGSRRVTFFFSVLLPAPFAGNTDQVGESFYTQVVHGLASTQWVQQQFEGRLVDKEAGEKELN
jgi:hypothetical protein